MRVKCQVQGEFEIPSQADILRALYAAWRLALRDPGAMAQFDLSIAGFWRSFFAVVLVAPFYFLLLRLEYNLLPAVPALGGFFLVKGLFFLISWAAYPLLMIPLTRMLGLGQYYIGFIVAYNWSAVIVILVLLPPFTLFGLQVIGPGAAGFLNLLATMAVLYYRWFLTRTALAISGGLALGFVFIDLLLSILFDITGNRLLGI